MKIITGRAKTGKSTYIYDEIKNELNNNRDENLILIVPDLMTYQTEYNIIQRLNSDGIMKVEVLSFKRLASKILEEMGGADAEDLSIYGRVMLLKQIFEEYSKDLKLFKKSTNHEGFLKEINLLIQELKQNLIEVDTLGEVANGTDNYLLKSKLEDIGLIYSVYIEKTLDKYFDEEDKYQLVISMIRDSDYIKNSRIWIDGFESFNYQRIMLIKSLAEYSKEVTLSLNIDSTYLNDLETFDDWEAFKTIYDTYELLSEEIDDIEIVSLSESRIHSKELALIEKNLFSLDPDQLTADTDKINIYSSMNPYTETEKTAIKIVSLVRDYDYRWKDIKVALGDMDNYGINIKKIFEKYEIPYFLDRKKDIMNNYISSYILSLLDIFIWNFRYENVFEFLKTGLSPLRAGDIQSLENYALQYGIDGSKWFEEIKSDPKFLKIEEIRKSFVDDFEGERKEFKNLSTANEITNFIFNYLKKHNVKSKLQRDIDRFKAEKDYERSSEFSQTWNSIMEVFEQIILVIGDSNITPIDYRKVLESGLKEVQISVIPPTIDTVEIGEVSRIGVNSSKALFIMGANEGNFESNNDKGLLLEDERKILVEKGIKFIDGADFAFFKDRHMLYKAFSSPTDRLYVSYSLGTVDGKSLQPSLYIDTLKTIFPSIKEETDITGNDDINHISNYKGTYDFLVENIRKHIDGIEVDNIWKTTYKWYRDNDQDGSFEQIIGGLNFKNTSESIKPEIIASIYGQVMNTSVSRLETYAGCNFKYFADNVLKIKARETQKIQVYDIGNIYHNAIEGFINRVMDKDIGSLGYDDIDHLIEEIINDSIEDYSSKVTAFDANSRNKYSKNKIRRVLKRTAYTLVKHLQSSEFRPKYTELQIGIIDENEEKAREGVYLDHVEINMNDTSVRLRGKIDRIDSYIDNDGQIYVVIIDYKSSATSIDLADVFEGLQIQLLVYLNAIIENGEKLFHKKPKIGGVFYYAVDDPIIKEQGKDVESEIFKALKLRGYLLEDIDLAKKMDINLDNGATSNILPTAITQTGNFHGNYKNQLTEDEFDKLLLFVNYKCKELVSSIINGEFKINPFKKSDGRNPCTYCEFMGICKFDKDLGNEYRRIYISKDEAKTNILAKGGRLKDGVD